MYKDDSRYLGSGVRFLWFPTYLGAEIPGRTDVMLELPQCYLSYCLRYLNWG